MILFFNRKELFVTFSIDKQSEIRKILNENSIDYKIKIKNQNSKNRYLQNPDFSCEYIFYVHKKDYDKAFYLINKK